MALRRAQPYTFSPAGVSDTLDGTNVFPGSMAQLGNLIPDFATPNLWAPRPASVSLTTFAGFTGPIGMPSVFKVVGTLVYGLVPTGLNAGHEQPFCYDLINNVFITITGITNANTPQAALSTGPWEPPTVDVIGTFVIFTHSGFVLGGGVLFGWINISNPAAPTWAGGNTATNPLPSRPSVVRNFNGRAYYLVNPTTGQPGAYFSDVLVPLTITNAANVLTFDDNQKLTAAIGLPLSNQLGGILQSLMVFKGTANIYQITGDAATSNLTRNTLNVATGTFGQRGVCSTPQGVAFNAPDGIRIIDWQARVSEPIGLYGAGVNRPFVFAVQPTRVALSCNANVLRCTVQNSLMNGSPYQEYWYDMTKQTWSGPHTFPPAMSEPYLSTFIVAVYGGGGALWRSDITLSSSSTFVENGTQMVITWQTSILPDFQSMNELELTEQTLNMNLDANGSIYSLLAIGGTGAFLSSRLVPQPTAGSTWGNFNWGQASWGSSQTGLVPIRIDWPNPVIARKMQFQLVGNSFSTFRIGDMFMRMRQLGYLQQSMFGA
jgi:hypothetical protein